MSRRVLVLLLGTNDGRPVDLYQDLQARTALATAKGIGIDVEVVFSAAFGQYRVIRKRLSETASPLDAVVLESNYDPQMLARGPYPPWLQDRIRGPGGHLSNQEAATFLQSVTTPSLKGVFLAHLSDTNNCPALAFQAAEEALGDIDIPLYLTHQDNTSKVVTV